MNSVKKYAKPPANKADEVIVVAKPEKKARKEVLSDFLNRHGIAAADVDKFVMRRYIHERNDGKNGQRNALLVAVKLESDIYVGWCRRMSGDPEPWNQQRAEEIVVGRIKRLMEGKRHSNVPPKMAKIYKKFISDVARRFMFYDSEFKQPSEETAA